MLGAAQGDGRLVGAVQRHVVPALGLEELDAVGAGLALEAREQRTDAALGGLVGLAHADAPAIVPHAHGHGHLQHAGGIQGLPEVALAGAGIADGAEGHLVAAVGEVRVAMQRLVVAEDLAGLREPEQARHLSGRGGDVGRGIRLGHQVLPFAVVVEAARGEVAVHAAAGAAGVGAHIGVRIELREPLLHGELPDGEHEGHVAVVAAAPIAIAELLGHAHLRQLLAIAEDPELGFAAKDLLAADERRLAAQHAELIVAQDFLFQFAQADLGFGCGLGAGHGVEWVPGEGRGGG